MARPASRPQAVAKFKRRLGDLICTECRAFLGYGEGKPEADVYCSDACIKKAVAKLYGDQEPWAGD